MICTKEKKSIITITSAPMYSNSSTDFESDINKNYSYMKSFSIEPSSLGSEIITVLVIAMAESN